MNTNTRAAHIATNTFAMISQIDQFDQLPYFNRPKDLSNVNVSREHNFSSVSDLSEANAIECINDVLEMLIKLLAKL